MLVLDQLFVNYFEDVKVLKKMSNINKENVQNVDVL